MTTRAGVILSGGLDSTVCLAIADRDCDEVLAVTYDYGQRHKVEVGHAAAVAASYGAEHLVVPIDLRGWGGSALTDDTIAIPDDGGAGIPVTYVPARNLIFLAVAVGIAEARDLDAVYIGVNALDYSGYPDCRPEFVDAFAATAALALKRGVEGNPVDVRAPLIAMPKADIVRLAIELDAPLHLTYSCYRGGDRPCGACDSCRIRAAAFADASIADPAS
ncbi:MAG TPA: 7-cyano-7-deazaguanine synthase QueC [Acidimicrobiales bacterium]|nr:7-cyano-7-deazaguanine synthase QueC [Acidimicrobiales bacterium]